MEALQQRSSEIATEGKQYFFSSGTKVGQAKSRMFLKEDSIAPNYDEERIGTMKRAVEHERDFEKNLDNATTHLRSADLIKKENGVSTFCLVYQNNTGIKELITRN